VSKLGDVEETEETTTGLARVIENAARIGDAKGDDEGAIRLLENGLGRFSDAPPVDRVRALLYLVDLNVRIGRESTAVELLSEASSIDLPDDDREAVAIDFEHAREVVEERSG
jgi:hypothetical protein